MEVLLLFETCTGNNNIEEDLSFVQEMKCRHAIREIDQTLEFARLR